MRRASANKILAITSAGYRAGLIVRVGAGADDRRIADSPGQLVCHSTGGGRSGQITGGMANKLPGRINRKSTRLNSSHQIISYAVFCLKKKTKKPTTLI